MKHDSEMSAASGATWRSPHGRRLPHVGERTLVMGILNVTPDSFSDGGELPDTGAVVERAGGMLAAGADVLDVGGESTRPGAAPVTEGEELARVLPAVRALRQRWPDAPISIDTYKPRVAEAAIDAGADLINDIWGFAHGMDSQARCTAVESFRPGGEPGSLPHSPMAEVAARLGAPVILMHNRPDRKYTDFWADITADLRLSVALAERAGVVRGQIWLDPGFGFAKGPRENLEVLKHLDRIVAMGFPVLIGTSRKSTIGRVLGTAVDDRLEGTAATLVWAIAKGCSMVRVHDVGIMQRFVRMTDAIRAGVHAELSDPAA